jgi:hypothetical protein
MRRSSVHHRPDEGTGSVVVAFLEVFIKGALLAFVFLALSGSMQAKVVGHSVE